MVGEALRGVHAEEAQSAAWLRGPGGMHRDDAGTLARGRNGSDSGGVGWLWSRAMKIETNQRRQFGSDNYAGICPEAFAALTEANRGHAVSYGNDPWTEKAAGLIRELFETDCEVFFVFNGTAANALSLAALCQSYHSVLCHEQAHTEVAECGAPEFFAGGSKVQLLSGACGKIDPAGIERVVKKRLDLHYPKPRALSLTQATEAGTLYSVAELKQVIDTARQFGLRVHMDGARFANAVAAMGVKPREITWQAGVEVLSFGSTKNGLAVGEAVVFFNRELGAEFDYRCKQAGQLASKMRFVSAPWVGILQDGAWLRHAARANAMARRLEAGLRGVRGCKLAFPCETNAMFVEMPKAIIEALWQRGWKFYTHVSPGQCRLMCSWDTMEEEVDEFAADVRSLAEKQ
jgi:threonine aldolase